MYQHFFAVESKGTTSPDVVKSRHPVSIGIGERRSQVRCNACES